MEEGQDWGGGAGWGPQEPFCGWKKHHGICQGEAEKELLLLPQVGSHNSPQIWVQADCVPKLTMPSSSALSWEALRIAWES